MKKVTSGQAWFTACFFVPGLLLLVSAASAQLVPFTDRSTFASAAPAATNVVNFENHSGEEGFLPDFTELGFVTFHANANYGQEVIVGYNIGQPGNKVYITVARDLGQTIADVTFGNGVQAVGFDLKNTGNNLTTGSQGFLASIFSFSTLLGAVPITSPAGGTTFQFAGVTSSAPITEIRFSSYEASPNQNIVLDNFALPSELEVRITDIRTVGQDVNLTWETIGGITNFVQTADGVSSGHLQFSDASGPILVSGSGQVSASYSDPGALGSHSTRFYRIRLAP
jgi:hypothetical protein